MTEPSTESSRVTDISRRDVITKVAVVGAVAWSVPLLVSTPAHATGSVQGDSDGPIDCIKLMYIGGGAWIPTFAAGQAPDWYNSEQLIEAFVGDQTTVLVPDVEVAVCRGETVLLQPVDGGGGDRPVLSGRRDDKDKDEDGEEDVPETTEAPATTEAPETTEAPPTTQAPPTTEAPPTTQAPKTTEPAPAVATSSTTESDPVVIFFDMSADSPMTEGDLIGPFEVVDITHVEG